MIFGRISCKWDYKLLDQAIQDNACFTPKRTKVKFSNALNRKINELKQFISVDLKSLILSDIAIRKPFTT